MTTDLETRLGDHFQHLAEVAPAPTIDVVDIDRRLTRRRRRRVVTRCAAVAAVVAGVGGVLAMQHEPSDDAAAGVIDSPLVITYGGVPYTDLVKPGSVTLQLADGQHITFSIIAAPFYDGYGQQSLISYDGYSTGRAQPIDADLPLIPEPELGGNDRLVFWTGVPTNAVWVELHRVSGDVLRQQPAQGIAAFPVDGHATGDRLVAIDGAGRTVATVSWADVRVVGSGSTNGGAVTRDYSSLAPPSDYGTPDMSRLDGLTQSEEDGYRKFGNDTMRACLASDATAWTECIQSTDAAVKAYLDELQATKSAP